MRSRIAGLMAQAHAGQSHLAPPCSGTALCLGWPVAGIGLRPNLAKSGAVLAAVKAEPPLAVALPLVGPALTAAARDAPHKARSGWRNGASIEQRNWRLANWQT